MKVNPEKGKCVAWVGMKMALKSSPHHPAQETAGSHRCGHQHACGRALRQRALRSHRVAEVAVRCLVP